MDNPVVYEELTDMARQLSDQPNWFKAANYDMSGATLHEWLVELTQRQSCFRILTRAESDERIRRGRAFVDARETWYRIHESGSLTRTFRQRLPELKKHGMSQTDEQAELWQGMEAIRAGIRAQRDTWLTEQSEPTEQGTVVTRVTKGDVLLRFLLEGELDQLATEVQETDSFPKGVLSPMPVDKIGRSPRENTRFLKVDLLATDAIIKTELDDWLRAERQRQASSGTITPQVVSEADFADWCKFGVLPYLDLAFAIKYEGLHLTQERIGNLLFPDEPDVSLAERVRKVTRPKALAISSDSFLSGMQRQYEQVSPPERNA